MDKLMVIFCLLGVLIYLPCMVVFWIANEDVLSGSSIPSSVIIVSAAMDVFSKVVSPYIVRRLPLIASMLVCSFLVCGSLILVVLIDTVLLRLVGIFTFGYSCGMSQIFYLQQCANFENSDKLSGMFMCGANLAGVVASFGYTGLTTWFCAAPRTVIASCIPIVFLPLAFYPILVKQAGSKYNTVEYHQINEAAHPQTRKIAHKIQKELMIFHRAFHYVSYYFLTSFSLSFSMSSLLTTLTFPKSPFLPRDHYQYYRLISDVGMGLGSFQIILSSCVRSRSQSKVRGIWVLVLFSVMLTLFYFFASWYHFLSNVYAFFAFLFIHGVLFGVIMTYTPKGTSELFLDPNDKGTALGFVSLGGSAGSFAAGLLGLYVEKQLKRHCVSRLLLGQFCLSRIPTSLGWKANAHCL